MEVSRDEEGTVKVREHNPGFPRPEGLERHRVVARPDCSPTLVHGAQEATFNDFLQVFFLITLGLGVIHIALYCTSGSAGLSWSTQTQLWGAALLTIFVAIGFVTAFERKMTKNIGAALLRREGTTKISVIKHV